MDKRTFLFFISLTAALFLVNMFFQWNQDEKLRQWNTQQLAKKSQKEQQLILDIKERTASVQTIPLMLIYSDAKGEQLLTSGVPVEDALVTLSWGTESPKTIYARNSTSDSFQEYKRVNTPINNGDPLIYQKGSQTTFPIGNLPEFGKFDLQIVSLASPEHPTTVTLGEYADGSFTVPLVVLGKIQKELHPESQEPANPIKANSLVLRKSDNKYLPIGVYNPKNDEIVYFEDMPALNSLVTKQEDHKFIPTGNKTEERYYVLENDYQQLVFSNYGGSLTEINLPFSSDTNKKSVVKEIEFDRDMVEFHPYNAHFPAHPYMTPGEKSGEFVKHDEGKLGGYYPLIRRDLIETGKHKSVKLNPRYYSPNLLSEYPELSELIYEVKQFDATSITFEATQSNRRITKTYSISQEEEGAPYCIDLTIKVEGDSRGLWLSSGVPEVELISGAPAPALKYRITRNNKSEVENLDLPKETLTVSSVYPDWICNSNGFLGLIVDPLTEIDPGYRALLVQGTSAPSRLVEIDQQHERFKAADLPGYMTLLPLKNNGGTMKFRIFAGPFEDDILNAVDAKYSDPATGYNPDYIASQSFHGWFAFISEPFANFLFILMKFFYSVTGSWAFSIVLLTVALRLMLYPLNAWSTKSMTKMQQIAPMVTTIQEKYKKDPKKAQMEIMNLYREKGVNPLSGCLPLLIQMPFLIGMFDLLKSTFELRGASFIPGWINNLTSPDVLFSWNTPIFFIGNQFHLLPFLLGAVMFAQQRLMSTLPKDPALWTDQQRQQRSMGTFMALIFTVMFYNFPSGLNIYWLSSMLLGMLQQWWNQRSLTKEEHKAVQCKPGKNS